MKIKYDIHTPKNARGEDSKRKCVVSPLSIIYPTYGIESLIR